MGVDFGLFNDRISGSLDFPAEFLDGYFTRVALMQVFQIWAVLGFGSGLYALFVEVTLRLERPDSLSAALVEAKEALLPKPTVGEGV